MVLKIPFFPTPTKKTNITENSQKNIKHRIPQKNINSYRGRGRKNRHNKEFTVVLVNMRGFKSKETSLKKNDKESEAKCSFDK